MTERTEKGLVITIPTRSPEAVRASLMMSVNTAARLLMTNTERRDSDFEELSLLLDLQRELLPAERELR